MTDDLDKAMEAADTRVKSWQAEIGECDHFISWFDEGGFPISHRIEETCEEPPA